MSKFIIVPDSIFLKSKLNLMIYSCLERPSKGFYSQSIFPVKVFYYLLNLGLIKYFLRGGL
jgi:hypothetical protein